MNVLVKLMSKSFINRSYLLIFLEIIVKIQKEFLLRIKIILEKNSFCIFIRITFNEIHLEENILSGYSIVKKGVHAL